jgi:hypothetical protein
VRRKRSGGIRKPGGSRIPVQETTVSPLNIRRTAMPRQSVPGNPAQPLWRRR